MERWFVVGIEAGQVNIVIEQTIQRVLKSAGQKLSL